MGAVALAIVLVIGYLVIAQARNIGAGAIASTNITDSVNSGQTTILAGFGLLGLGVILMGAWGLITLWK